MFCARRPVEGRPSGWMRARPFVKRENWRWQRWFCFALLFNGPTISSQLYNCMCYWMASVFTLSNMKDSWWLGESEHWCFIFVFSEKKTGVIIRYWNTTIAWSFSKHFVNSQVSMAFCKQGTWRWLATLATSSYISNVEHSHVQMPTQSKLVTQLDAE